MEINPQKEKAIWRLRKVEEWAYGHAFTRTFFSFVFNFSSPKCDEVKEFKRQNLSTDIQVKTDKIFKAHLFLVTLKKRGHVWIAGPRALQKFHFISKLNPFLGRRWLQLFFPFAVVLTSKVAAHGIRLAASFWKFFKEHTITIIPIWTRWSTPSLQTQYVVLVWLYLLCQTCSPPCVDARYNRRCPFIHLHS